MRWPDRYALDPHAEFYAKALAILVSDLATQARQPLLLVWRLSNIVLVLIALAVLGWGVLQIEDRTLPVQLGTTRLLTPTVAPGGKLRVRYTLLRLRACAVDIGASVFDGADELHSLVTEHRDASGPIGFDHVVRSFSVPPDAVPGHARLRVVWSYVCPGNYAQVLSPLPLVFPDLPFTIEGVERGVSP